MKSAQLIPYALPSQSITLSTVSQYFSVPLRLLPKQQFGRVAHLAGLTFETIITPTYTTAPTVLGLQAAVNRCDIFDGQQTRFQGGFNAMRFFERLENGALLTPDPIRNASANARYYQRTWNPGPPLFAGSPSDFVIPCAALETGEVKITTGVLTDISADTTACTVVINITAWLYLLDEVRIPPFYERQVFAAASADNQLSGRALYAYLGIGNSSSYDALTTGDLSNVTVDLGSGQIVPAIHVATLNRAYQSQMRAGLVGTTHGEQRNDTNDVNDRIVNDATPTALAAGPADLSPVLWAAPQQMISKLTALAESTLRVRWSGSQASGLLLTGRFLPQPQSVVGAMADRALGNLSVKVRAASVKTLSKQLYTGPFPEFMPITYKIR